MLALKEIREGKNLTQADVARELGISRQTYNNYELGKRQADYETLLRLAELFDTSVEHLLTGRKSGNLYDLTLEPPEQTAQRAREMMEEKEKSPFPIKMTEKELVERISNLGNKDLYDLYTFLDYLDFRSGDKEKDHP